MDRIRSFTQAYSQAPWRKQLQGIGVFLAVLVIFLLAASVFVSITARSATVGKDIQRNRDNIEALEFEIANMRTELALQTSTAVMKQRAIEMGFRPATPEELIYIKVPGYTRESGLEFASPPQSVKSASPVLSPSFTNSWVDWFAQQFRVPQIPLSEVQP